MPKNVDVIILFDIYGDMLTEKQRDFISYYYNDDLSLAEIAENEGITRQGVRDAIKRAEAQLYEIDSHLGLVKKYRDIQQSAQEINSLADKISEINTSNYFSREINDAVARIRFVAGLLTQ